MVVTELRKTIPVNDIDFSRLNFMFLFAYGLMYIGGGFPGSAKAVAEWFPPGERSRAFGLFNTGSSVGAMITPPLIAFIVLSLSLR